MRFLRRSHVAVLPVLCSPLALLARDAYQQLQAEKAHDAWRQKAFFENVSRGNAAPPAFFQLPRPKEAVRAIDSGAQQQFREDSRAWNLKLEQEAREERRALYQSMREKSGGRMPLTEPPAFTTADQWVDWMLRQVEAVPNDPYVAWCAALIALEEVRPDATVTKARGWLTHANQDWPETQALLGRMLLLGEGGPKDESRGWALLLEAEPKLRPLERSSRGRSHLYYALGRGYAERGDDLAALWAFEHNMEGSSTVYSTYEYLSRVFWPTRASRAAEVVSLAEASDYQWQLSPRQQLRSVSRRDPAPAATRQEIETLLELKRQSFLLDLAEQDRRGPGRYTARAEVAALIKDGVPDAAAEFLLPDASGHFFQASSPGEQEQWRREGASALERLTNRNDPRALAAMAERSLRPESGAPDLAAAAQWAERGLAAGDPWGAVYLGAFYGTDDTLHLPDAAQQAAQWLDRAEKARDAAKAWEGVYWFLKEEVVDARHPAAWLQIGMSNGSARAAALSATDQLVRLTRDPARASADRLLWADAERTLINALPVARTDKDRRFLRAELEALSLRQLEARRDERRAAQREDAFQAELDALVATETPRLESSLADALNGFTTRITSGELVGEWDWATKTIAGHYENAFSERAHALLSRKDPAANLTAAALFAKSAQSGHLLDIFEAAQAVERAAPASPLLQQWRVEIAAALETRAERGDASAALWLAEEGGPDGRLAHSSNADLHAARWYRRAGELGAGQALYKLHQHFEDKAPVNELYRALGRFLQSHDDDDFKQPQVMTAALQTLPARAQEVAAIDAYWKTRDARREHSRATVARELPQALGKIEEALVKLEAEAEQPGRPGQPFFQEKSKDDYTDADNELEEDAPGLETELVIMARHLGAATSGDFQIARTLPGEWFAAAHEHGRRWNAAMETILARDARLGDLAALNRLCALHSPIKTPEGTATGWEKDPTKCLEWCRLAIAAGEWEQIDTVVALYANRPDELASYRVWTEFRTEAQKLKDASRAERVAFARAHLPR